MPSLPLNKPHSHRLAPISAGTYLRMRREAAGLDMVDVALAIAGIAATSKPAEVDVVAAEEAGVSLLGLEGDEQPFATPLAHHAFINALEQAIRFDTAVYWALFGAMTDPAVIVPPICRDCACSFMDPCSDARGPCAWANAGRGEQPLCTHCEEKGAGPGPCGPVGGNREHADAA